jgi:nitrogen fixation protein FixH
MMARPFTGRHMAAILVAMFGVIIAVNVLMARAAIQTFGGTVVENSYVASQRYNGWLAAARAQDRLAWRPTFALDAERRITVTLAGPQGAIGDARLAAVVTHPLGRLPARTYDFQASGDGRYQSTRPLPGGRWLIHLTASRGQTRAVFDDEIAR